MSQHAHSEPPVELAYASAVTHQGPTKADWKRLRIERVVRWIVFLLFLISISQYLSLSNGLSMVLLLAGFVGLIAWFIFASVIFPVIANRAGLRYVRAPLIAIVAMLVIVVSGFATRWPFHLAYFVSTPFLERAADRVEQGKHPGFCGLFIFTDWQLHDAQTVGLYFYRDGGGWTGLVRHPSAGKRIWVNSNNGGPKSLNGRWQLVDED